MCRVLNKHHAGLPSGAIYIGRGAKWGNPFRIGPDGDRATVIRRYEQWLADRHDLLRALDELRGHDLVCFCAPKPCHGDLLLRLANATRGERIAWWRGVKGRATSAAPSPGNGEAAPDKDARLAERLDQDIDRYRCALAQENEIEALLAPLMEIPDDEAHEDELEAERDFYWDRTDAAFRTVVHTVGRLYDLPGGGRILAAFGADAAAFDRLDYGPFAIAEDLIAAASTRAPA